MEITAMKLDELPDSIPSQHQVQVFGIGVSTEIPSPSTSDNGSPGKEKGSKGPKCTKTYNSKWESDPLLKTWISRHPRDNGKVVCRFCQSVIRAHKNDLLEHTRTLKHQRNFMQNSSAEDYNQFIVELNELRKETNAIAKKRLTSPVTPTTSTAASSSCTSTTTSPTSSLSPISTASVENTVIKYDQPTITVIAPRGCTSNAVENGTSFSICSIPTSVTSIESSDMHTTSLSNTTTTFPSLAACIAHSNTVDNCISNVNINTDCVTSVPAFLNLTSGTSTNGSLGDVLGDSDDLWQESEDFMSAESPRDLVSVILEEQQSPTSNCAANNNGSNCCKQLLMQSDPCEHVQSNVNTTTVSGLNTMILNGINTNIAGINVNLNLLDSSEESINGVVPVTTSHTICEDSTNSLANGTHLSASINDHHEETSHHETLLLTTKSSTSLPFTVSDVRTAIEEGHFSFSDLCSLAKAAVNQIDRCINETLCPSSTNGLTFCTTTSNPLLSPSTHIPSLSILSPHGAQIHPVQSSNSFSFKRDRTSRKRRSAEHQVILSKVDQL